MDYCRKKALTNVLLVSLQMAKIIFVHPKCEILFEPLSNLLFFQKRNSNIELLYVSTLEKEIHRRRIGLKHLSKFVCTQWAV